MPETEKRTPFKWLIATVIAILAAGGGVVAYLNYFSGILTEKAAREKATIVYFKINAASGQRDFGVSINDKVIILGQTHISEVPIGEPAEETTGWKRSYPSGLILQLDDQAAITSVTVNRNKDGRLLATTDLKNKGALTYNDFITAKLMPEVFRFPDGASAPIPAGAVDGKGYQLYYEVTKDSVLSLQLRKRK